MAVNLQVFSAFSTRIDNEWKYGGDLKVPVNFSITGNEFSSTETVANGANTVLYANQLSSFNYLEIASDYNTRIVFTDINSNTFGVHLRGTGVANKYGVPYRLSSRFTDGGNAYVNSVQVFNSSGSSAKVTCRVLE